MALRDEILTAAQEFAGYRYRLDPPPSLNDGTIDCSLFVLEAFEKAGAPFTPGIRTAEQIRQACLPVGWDDVAPGDLLFFEGTYDAGPPSADGHIASHIGISLGKGTHKMWDAHERQSSPDAVGITTLSADWWQPKLFEARRAPQLAGATDGANPPADSPSSIMRGIDVASHQGAVDWAAVAASGVTFAFTKATGGTWYRNPTCAANWLGMQAAGLARGAYHFAFETSGQAFPGDGPEAEADYFLAEIRRAGGIAPGDLLVLDIEDGQGDLGEWALRWLQRVESVTGLRPLLYSGAWFTDPHGFAKVPALAGYALWLADYGAGWPDAPSPWASVDIWQHDDKGRVPGVSGLVDMNKFQGTRQELLALGKSADGAVEPAPTQSDELTWLQNLVGNGFHEDGVVVPALVGAVASRDWGQVDAVIRWLRENNPQKAA
jgi:lysozyme